jgi:hypothetical protein
MLEFGETRHDEDRPHFVYRRDPTLPRFNRRLCVALRAATHEPTSPRRTRPVDFVVVVTGESSVRGGNLFASLARCARAASKSDNRSMFGTISRVSPTCAAWHDPVCVLAADRGNEIKVMVVMHDACSVEFRRGRDDEVGQWHPMLAASRQQCLNFEGSIQSGRSHVEAWNGGERSLECPVVRMVAGRIENLQVDQLACGQDPFRQHRSEAFPDKLGAVASFQRRLIDQAERTGARFQRHADFITDASPRSAACSSSASRNARRFERVATSANAALTVATFVDVPKTLAAAAKVPSSMSTRVLVTVTS